LIKKPSREKLRCGRRWRVRRKIQGTASRPRLNVFRSLNHIYANIIDDNQRMTMISVSSLSPELRNDLKSGGNMAAAAAVGKLVAQKAIQAGVKKVIFDRAGYLYHGRIKALAEAARESGLEF
jgi:large subunit ribosomal protein L18